MFHTCVTYAAGVPVLNQIVFRDTVLMGCLRHLHLQGNYASDYTSR